MIKEMRHTIWGFSLKQSISTSMVCHYYNPKQGMETKLEGQRVIKDFIGSINGEQDEQHLRQV